MLVRKTLQETEERRSIAGIEITWPDGTGAPRSRRFTKAFQVGRNPACDVALASRQVSRKHLEIAPDKDGWVVRDLQSSNGTFVDGRRIESLALDRPTRLQLGTDGLEIILTPERASSQPAVAQDDATVVLNKAPPRAEPAPAAYRERHADTAPPPRQRRRSAHYQRPGEAPPPPRPDPVDDEEDAVGSSHRSTHPHRPSRARNTSDDDLSADQIAFKYGTDVDDEDAGDHTREVRRFVRETAKRERKRWRLVIAAVGVVFVAVVGILAYQITRPDPNRQIAIDLFYDMKAMELNLARLQKAVQATGEDELMAELQQSRAQMRQMRARYDTFLQEANLIDPTLDDEDLIILKIARIFGESELEMPPDFVDEIKNYIKKWQGSQRLETAIRSLNEQGFRNEIVSAFVQNGLPPHFLYLGLQESNFNVRAVGPRTRWGIAKGAWQFIPSTGAEYGLRIGPLKDERVYDPQDERFVFVKATRAAARFIRDIYTTDAQASGLLVMASYNWGPHRINSRLKNFPENPRERNFWAFLRKHNIPDETYNYVFYIFAAAVIGENPKLFGFDFDNPLQGFVDVASQ